MCFANASACQSATSCSSACQTSPKLCPGATGANFACPQSIRRLFPPGIHGTLVTQTTSRPFFFDFIDSLCIVLFCRAGGLPMGSGALCYSSEASCVSGSGRCSSGAGCALSYAFCSSGIAASSSNKWRVPRNLSTYSNILLTDLYLIRTPTPTAQRRYCSNDAPSNALPAASGLFCYADFASCLNGPNRCDLSTPCQLSFAQCASGMSGGRRNYNWRALADPFPSPFQDPHAVPVTIPPTWDQL